MIYANVAGIDLRFETEPSLFSPAKSDRGSLAMLSRISLESNDKVLDLGCGYGLLGIWAAKIIGAERVWMVDNDQTAVEYAAKNLAANGIEGVSVVLSDGFRELRETNFTKIVCNPPYHVDFSVPKHFIEKGFNRLVVGGTMYLVTKRRTWYENKLRSIFGDAPCTNWTRTSSSRQSRSRRPSATQSLILTGLVAQIRRPTYNPVDSNRGRT